MGMREIAPFGLRMPVELRARIEAEANANGRSMNTEVIARLWQSFEQAPIHMARSPAPATGPAGELNEIEKSVLTVFRRMTPERQLAFLTLFR